MKRRDFLRSAGVASAAMAFPKAGRLFAQGTAPETWRTFDVTTSAQVLKPSGTTRIWIPAALVTPAPFQKTFANDFKADGGTAKLIESSASKSRSSPWEKVSFVSVRSYTPPFNTTVRWCCIDLLNAPR